MQRGLESWEEDVEEIGKRSSSTHGRAALNPARPPFSFRLKDLIPVKNPKPVFFQVTVSKARVISVLFFRALENKHFGVRLKLMRLFKPSLRSAGVADPKLREVKGISPAQTHRALEAFTSTSPVTAERHSDTGNPLMASRNKEKKKKRERGGGGKRLGSLTGDF